MSMYCLGNSNLFQNIYRSFEKFQSNKLFTDVSVSIFNLFNSSNALFRSSTSNERCRNPLASGFVIRLGGLGKENNSIWYLSLTKRSSL